MNHWTRTLVMLVTCALALGAWTTSAFANTPDPLTGSNFQGADGDQDTEEGEPSRGHRRMILTLIEWARP